MSDISQEELIELLKKKELKITPQRLAICEYILKSEVHPTAEQIYEHLQKKHPTMSKATVYKTLALLEEEKMINEICLCKDASHYDSNITFHMNVICTKCGEIKDYQSQLVEDFWEKLKKELKKWKLKERMDIFIECEKCQEKSNE